MAKKELRVEARRLRAEEHMPITVIAERLGVSKSTAYEWTKDIPVVQHRVYSYRARTAPPSPPPLPDNRPKCRYCQHPLDNPKFCAECGTSVKVAEQLIYRHEEFSSLLRLLNAYDPYFPWVPTEARKEHRDPFGEQIAEGEVYFCKTVGVGWGDYVKLSRLSMQRLIYLTLGTTRGLREIATTLLEAQEQRQRQERPPSIIELVMAKRQENGK